ncbi:MAG TPA: DUF2914 domain-containing protein [Candidatus Paceibacterota bacterium]|nr:DUF2914 domain-containing protein [Candidatus Paceibacterota bacterium]HMO82777.1 DUF2914 domain-containing protein [Candidatus Paceibacterota bacterium]
MRQITNSAVYRYVERHWLTVAFLLGFLTDVILLNRVDDTFDNLILLFYFILATSSIILFYVGVAEKVSVRLVSFLHRYMPMVMQYSFGGLLSGMLIFYGRSGDFWVSAPYLLLIVIIMIANELIQKRSDRLRYNLSVYFIAVFSYLVLVIPVLLGEMGPVIFIGSGLLALLVIFFLLKALGKIIPHFLLLEKKMIVFSIAGLYVLFNAFYFLNIIPPIPLSLTELSIFQQVERTVTGGYRITKEDYFSPLNFFLWTEKFHPLPGGGAYCFARVYAPTALKTKVVHRWEYYEGDRGWVTRFTVPYQITGENINGYRGFTKTNNIQNGKWRCGVETERGQVLGRKTFIVDTTVSPKNIVTVVE